MSCSAWEPQLLQRKGLCTPENLPVSSDSSSSSSSSPDEGESAKRQERSEAGRGWYVGTPRWMKLLVSHTPARENTQVMVHPSLQLQQQLWCCWARHNWTGAFLAEREVSWVCQCSENVVQCQILPPVWNALFLRHTEEILNWKIYFCRTSSLTAFFFLPSSIHSEDFLFYHASKVQVSISNSLSLRFNSISPCHISLH